MNSFDNQVSYLKNMGYTQEEIDALSERTIARIYYEDVYCESKADFEDHYDEDEDEDEGEDVYDW